MICSQCRGSGLSPPSQAPSQNGTWLKLNHSHAEIGCDVCSGSGQMKAPTFNSDHLFDARDLKAPRVSPSNRWNIRPYFGGQVEELNPKCWLPTGIQAPTVEKNYLGQVYDYHAIYRHATVFTYQPIEEDMRVQIDNVFGTYPDKVLELWVANRKVKRAPHQVFAWIKLQAPVFPRSRILRLEQA